AVAALIGFAQVRNGSKFVAGGSSKTGFLRRFSRPFGEQLAVRAGDLDLMLIRASASEDARAPLEARARAWRDAFSRVVDG
ncbi:hypothetical protein AAHH78_37930, partial [Burkholderia pseudomallei]